MVREIRSQPHDFDFAIRQSLVGGRKRKKNRNPNTQERLLIFFKVKFLKTEVKMKLNSPTSFNSSFSFFGTCLIQICLNELLQSWNLLLCIVVG